MNTKKYYKNTQGGQVIIGALLLFLTIAITVLVGIATPVAIQVRSAADFLQSKQAYISADVLNEEALYRLNKGLTLPSNIVLSFNDSTSTALISTIGSQKQVLATGVSGLFTRLSQSIFTQGQGSFALNYGMQIGIGGITMQGSPTINGNVVSNGTIVGSGVPTVNGSLTAATIAPQSITVSYGSNATPSSSVNLGSVSALQDIAQSFTVSTTTPLSKVSLYLKKNGAPTSARVYIANDLNGLPDVNPIASGILNTTQTLSSFSWVPVTLTTNVSLTPGVTYWIVVDATTISSANYYVVGFDNASVYPGVSKLGVYGGAWNSSSSTSDMYFQAYIGNISSIDRVVVNGTASASTVTNSTVSGTLYCQTGTGNNKTCNTSSSTPNAITYPFSDTNISNWKAEATNGGVYNGNLTIEGITATTTGPLKINGDLKLSASGIMTMKGTIYVTGNVIVEGNSRLYLDASYGSKSGVLIADGTIQVTSSGLLAGNGTMGSYVTVVTTSGCGGVSVSCSSPAVLLSGNSDSVVVFAPNGRIKFEGSAKSKSLIGYGIDLSGNVVVNYSSLMNSISYDNTSSGGGSSSWITDTWKEISN